jgi:hypothetical protein
VVEAELLQAVEQQAEFPYQFWYVVFAAS